MPKVIMPIANGYGVSDSRPISNQECVNVYPVTEDVPSLAIETLRACPGVTQLATTGSGAAEANRGLYATAGGIPYFVNNTTLYKLEDDLSTLTSIGTIGGYPNRVDWAESENEVMILVAGYGDVAGPGTGYILDKTTDTLTQITDVNFTTTNGVVRAITFIDGYFAAVTNQGNVKISNLNDGLTWGALDFGSVERDPDSTFGIANYKNQLVVAGVNTLETFINVGGSGFPFERSNVFISYGFPHFRMGQVIGDLFFFIGQEKNSYPGVYIFGDSQPTKISTLAIDRLLRVSTGGDTAENRTLPSTYSWSYSDNGHVFVGWRLEDSHIVYDLQTGKWHERKSRIYNSTSQIWEDKTWRATGVIKAYNKYFLVGDTEDGRIGQLSIDAFSEYDNEMIATWSTQPFQNNMEPFFVPSIELTIESGVGDLSTTNPQVMMERSRNGGHTFSDQRWRDMGKVGEYYRRAIWRRNGKVDRFDMYRFHISDKIKKVGIQLTTEVTGG